MKLFRKILESFGQAENGRGVETPLGVVRIEAQDGGHYVFAEPKPDQKDAIEQFEKLFAGFEEANIGFFVVRAMSLYDDGKVGLYGLGDGLIFLSASEVRTLLASGFTYDDFFIGSTLLLQHKGRGSAIVERIYALSHTNFAGEVDEIQLKNDEPVEPNSFYRTVVKNVKIQGNYVILNTETLVIWLHRNEKTQELENVSKGDIVSLITHAESTNADYVVSLQVSPSSNLLVDRTGE